MKEKKIKIKRKMTHLEGKTLSIPRKEQR